MTRPLYKDKRTFAEKVKTSHRKEAVMQQLLNVVIESHDNLHGKQVDVTYRDFREVLDGVDPSQAWKVHAALKAVVEAKIYEGPRQQLAAQKALHASLLETIGSSSLRSHDDVDNAAAALEFAAARAVREANQGASR